MNNRTYKKNSVALMFLRQQPKALLGNAFIVFLGVVGLSLAVGAQPKPRLPKQPAALPPKIKALTPASSSSKQKSILESLLGLLQRKPFLGGSRSNGDGFCGITPAVLGETNLIWSDHPLFLWQGKVQTLDLRPYQFDVGYAKQPILWRFSPTAQQASYPKFPLQAGHRYELQVTYGSAETQQLSQWQQVFRVMDKTDRDRIDQELNSLELQLKTQAVTGEEVALAKANFFATKDLWSDAIQEIYAVGHPFSVGDKFLQAVTDRVCHVKPNSLGYLGY